MCILILFITILICYLFYRHARSKDLYWVKAQEKNINGYLLFIILFILPILLFWLSYNNIYGNTNFAYARGSDIKTFSIFLSGFSDDIHRPSIILSRLLLLLSLLIIPLESLMFQLFNYPFYIWKIKRKGCEINVKGLSDIEVCIQKALLISGLTIKPKIYYVHKDTTNTVENVNVCGIIGRGKSNINIVITDKLISLYNNNILSQGNIIAIILHEISHYIHNDFISPLWIKNVIRRYFIIFVVALFGSLLLTVNIYMSRERLLPTMILILLMLILSYLLLYLSTQLVRETEYLADARTSNVYNYKKELIEAIQKIHLFTYGQNLSFSILSFNNDGPLSRKCSTTSIIKMIRDFIYEKISWSVTGYSRIINIRENKTELINDKLLLSPYTIFSITFIVILFTFVFSTIILPKIIIYQYLTQVMSIYTAYSTSIVVLFLSLLPLQYCEWNRLKSMLQVRGKKLLYLNKYYWILILYFFCTSLMGIAIIESTGMILNIRESNLYTLYNIVLMIAILFWISRCVYKRKLFYNRL